MRSINLPTDLLRAFVSVIDLGSRTRLGDPFPTQASGDDVGAWLRPDGDALVTVMPAGVVEWDLEPESLATQVAVVNRLNATARRQVSFFAFTVPQYQRDPAYFEPLHGLRIRPGTEIYFALVPYHPDQQAAGTTEEQVRLIDENLVNHPGNGGAPAWGICTECGMARAEREEIPRLLDLHREILEAHATPAVTAATG